MSPAARVVPRASSALAPSSTTTWLRSRRSCCFLPASTALEIRNTAPASLRLPGMASGSGAEPSLGAPASLPALPPSAAGVVESSPSKPGAPMARYPGLVVPSNLSMASEVPRWSLAMRPVMVASSLFSWVRSKVAWVRSDPPSST